MRIVLIIGALLALGACNHVATVPMVNGSDLGSVGAQEGGSYAAMVQSGGWNMNTSVFGRSCSAHSYSADLNASFEQAMKTALTAGLQKVDFVGNVLPPPDLKAKGYDAQIAVTPTNASSEIQFTPGAFSGDESSQTKLAAILVVNYKDGTHQQQLVEGVGAGKASSVECGDVGAIEQSSAEAIKDIVGRTVLTAKMLLAQSKEGEGHIAATMDSAK